MEQKKFEPYVYYTPADNKKGVRVTVVGDVKDGVLNLAVSRCGEEDRYLFTKDQGRKDALARLEKGDYAATISCEKPNSAKFIAIATAVGAFVVKHSALRKLELDEYVYSEEVTRTINKNGVVTESSIQEYVNYEYAVVKTKKKRRPKSKRKNRVSNLSTETAE